MAEELMNQGLTLMLVGMGTVFVFLTALVAVTSLMSRLIAWLQPTAAPAGVTADEVAAISAAIAQHRSKK